MVIQILLEFFDLNFNYFLPNYKYSQAETAIDLV